MVECRINGDLYEVMHPVVIAEQAGNNTSSEITVKVADRAEIDYVDIEGESVQGAASYSSPAFPSAVEAYDLDLYQLPNGVKDEVTRYGEHIKRVGVAEVLSVASTAAVGTTAPAYVIPAIAGREPNTPVLFSHGAVSDYDAWTPAPEDRVGLITTNTPNRNLQRVSTTFALPGTDTPSASSHSFANGVGTITVLLASKWNRYAYIQSYITDSMFFANVGVDYILSVDIKASLSAGITGYFKIDARSPIYTPPVTYFTDTAGEWVRIGCKITMPSPPRTSSLVVISALKFAIGDVIQYRNFKLEKASVFTSWTPAPEDYTGAWAVPTTSAANMAALNTFLTAQKTAGTPVTVYYELSTPVVSQLPRMVQTNRVPQSGDLIELSEEGQTIFLGTCGIPTSPKIMSKYTPLVYRMVCGNGNSLLRRRNVNYGTQQKTVTQIVQYLFDTYIYAEGISLGQISSIPVLLDAYTAADINLQDVLNELAELVSGAWEVTNDRVFNFIAKEEFPAFAEVVTADNMLGAEIQTQTKDHDVRTFQTVKGVQVSTDEQTEDFTFDGVVNEFETMFPIISKPKVFINSVEVLSTHVGVQGLDDNDSNIWFLFAFNSRVLKYRIDSGALGSGGAFQLKYIGQFPLRVHAYNADRISDIATKTGTSGMVEHVLEDKTLTTVGDAQRIADSLVSQYSAPRGEVTWFTTAERIKAAGYSLSDFALLGKFTFAMPEIGLAGDYVITERRQESLSAAGAWEDQLKLVFKMVDRSYVKSYGQTLRELSKQQRNNIREDVIVVSQSQNSETAALSEVLLMEYGPIVFWPCAAAALGNDPFDGLEIYAC